MCVISNLRWSALFGAARKFDLWAPNEFVYQLPDASFLCEYFLMCRQASGRRGF